MPERVTRSEHIHRLMEETGLDIEALDLETAYAEAKRLVQSLEFQLTHRRATLEQNLGGKIPPRDPSIALLTNEINTILASLVDARRELNRIEIFMRQKGRL